MTFYEPSRPTMQQHFVLALCRIPKQPYIFLALSSPSINENLAAIGFFINKGSQNQIVSLSCTSKHVALKIEFFLANCPCPSYAFVHFIVLHLPHGTLLKLLLLQKKRTSLRIPAKKSRSSHTKTPLLIMKTYK